MKALVYLKIRTLINSLKQLKEKPSRLISALFYLSFLAFIFITPGSGLDTDQTEISDPRSIPYLIFMAILFVIVLFINAVSWHSGTKQGMNIFTLPDTQFLFVSPLKPATILLYGMLSQLKTALISTLFLLYQGANLKNLGLDTKQIIVLFVVWFLLMFSNHIITAFVYAISFKSEARKNLVQFFIYAIPLISILLYGFFVMQESSFLTGATELLSSKILYLIPGAGWVLGIMDGLLLGFEWYNIACAIVFVLVPIIILRVIYKIDFDYYEDALSMVQTTPTANSPEAIEQATRKRLSKIKLRKLGIGRGFGENTIFFRQWLEFRRSRPQIIGLGMLTSLVILAIISMSSTNLSMTAKPLIYWSCSVLIMFFTAFNSTTLKALNEDQFFTLPGNSKTKIFYAGILGILWGALDLIPGYLFVTIKDGMNPLLLIVGLLLSTSLLVVMNSSQIIIYRIFGDIKSAFSVMFLMLLTVCCILPGIALIIIGVVSLMSAMVWWAYLLIALGFIVNCLFGILGIFVGAKYLEQGPIR